MNKEFLVRCRGVIIHNGKLLVVKHAHDTSFAALPGGHLEYGEDPKECLRRELVEELGIEPNIGRLLYVNTFLEGTSKQPVEFFFEILNSGDYLKIGENERTHEHEIEEFFWVEPTDNILILPKKFGEAFRSGEISFDETIFITD